MPAERVSMRKVRDVLRLTDAMGMSRRLVREATGIGKTAIGEYARRAAVAGLSWSTPDEIDDAELERQLFPPKHAASSAVRTEPDWAHIHTELRRSTPQATPTVGSAVGTAIGGIAPRRRCKDACGRREAVRRLVSNLLHRNGCRGSPAS
jgi:hypothetical protein